jgi:hypothetical protein
LPQLTQLAWHRKDETLAEEEALALFDRDWRHIARPKLEPAEREFIARMVERYGKEVLLV